MDPRRVWLCRPAAWRRIQPWPRPNGPVQDGVGGRLLAARRRANMVRGVVPHLTMDAGRFGELRELLQEAVCGRASCDDLHTGDGWWCCEAWRG